MVDYATFVVFYSFVSNGLASVRPYQCIYCRVELTNSPIVLLYYDYALTFRSECKYIWRAESRTKPSTILYIFCRYALVANVLYLLAVSGKLGSKYGEYLPSFRCLTTKWAYAD